MGFYINVSVFRQKNGNRDMDCTNGGVTSKNDDFVLVLREEDIPADCRYPVLIVQERRGYKFAVPVKPASQSSVGYMMGGNFVYSCDSRFRQTVNEYPIPVHDRTETPELYARLSE